MFLLVSGGMIIAMAESLSGHFDCNKVFLGAHFKIRTWSLRHGYLEVSPARFNGVYSQVSLDSTEGKVFIVLFGAPSE